jgi:hypothetical protein
MTGEFRSYKITDAAGVLANRAVVQGTNAGEVAKPGAANAGKFVGITQEAQATQNKSVLVKESGRSFAVASGAIAVGDAVNIGDTTGKVASCQTGYVATPGTAALVYCIGFARTAATADGDIIEIQIQPHLVKTAAS